MTEPVNEYSLLSDTILANYAKKGDDNAFEELVIRYLGTINIIAKKYSAEGYEHNDFVQEGLLGLLYSCRTFDENQAASFKSYMSIIVERRLISIIRKTNAGRNIPQASLVQMDDINDFVDTSADDPEKLLMCNEHLKSVLRRLKTALSCTEYEVLMLYGNGLSYKEIAEKLDLSEKTVDNALQRARKKISRGKLS